MLDNRFVLVDTETMGLNPQTDPIIELGAGIYDMDFKLVDTFVTQVWESPWYDDRFNELHTSAARGDKGAQIVLDMHYSNGLWNEAFKTGVTPSEASGDLCAWLDSHGVKNPEPLVGSSIGFDVSMLGSQMPDVLDRFGYRVVDISSLKLLWSARYPAAADRLSEVWPSRKAHRALDDIEDSVRELEFYINFIEKKGPFA